MVVRACLMLVIGCICVVFSLLCFAQNSRLDVHPCVRTCGATLEVVCKELPSDPPTVARQDYIDGFYS